MELIQRYNIVIVISFLVISIFIVPIGISAPDHLDTDLRVDDIEENNEITSFTSLQDNLLIVIDGTEDIISQEFHFWLDVWLSSIKSEEIVQSTLLDNGEPIHIFKQIRPIIKEYFENIFYATALANLTGYVLIELTNDFINSIVELSLLDEPNPIEMAFNLIINRINTELPFLAFGIFAKDFAISWMNKTKLFVQNNNITSNYFNEISNDWKSQTDYWLEDFEDEQITEIFNVLIQKIDSTTLWEEEFTYSTLAKILFNSTSEVEIQFLDDLFAGGQATNPIIQTDALLYEVIKGAYEIPGLDPKIIQLFRDSLTNSDNSLPPTSVIIQYRLSANISKQQLSDILDFFVEFVSDARVDNPFDYNIAFLSIANYRKERAENLNIEFTRLDAITLFIVLFILILWLKDLKLIFISVFLSWITTQIAKGLIVTFVPDNIFLIDISLSIGSAALFGASLNYTIFFIFRYREEISNQEHIPSIITASKTAIHSIMISGAALFITFIPLISSSLDIIQSLAFTVTFGLFIELLLLSLMLPSLFFNLHFDFKDKKISGFTRFKFRGYKITKKNYRQVLIVTFIVALLTGFYLSGTETNANTDDFIGGEGETDLAFQILNNDYSERFFSKLLIKIKFNQNILNGNSEVFSDIVELTNSLSEEFLQIKGIDDIVSLSHPLGIPTMVDTSLQTLVDRQIYDIIKNLIVDNANNETYIILFQIYEPSSRNAIKQTENVISILNKFTKNTENVEEGTVKGFSVLNLTLEKGVIEELNQILVMSIILLTLFLWTQLKSISVPLRLEFTIILGTVYALGITSIIWQVVFNGTLNLIINATALVVLLGLGADFDIYIFTRISEEYEKNNDMEKAIEIALEKSGPAIRTSGLAMAASFLSLLTGSLVLTQQFGLITFIAIILDIYFIRTILVPAILLIRHHD